MVDKILMLSKGQNISLIPNWLMLNNAIRSGNLQVLIKLLKQAKDSNPPLRPNSFSFIFAIWSGNPEILNEVIKLAKKKHGMDFIPDFQIFVYAVLTGNVPMVERILQIAQERKRSLTINFEVLNYAAWSNCTAMINKIIELEAALLKQTTVKPQEILRRGSELKLHEEALNAVALCGNPGMIAKLVAVANKYDIPVPKPSKKTLANAIKCGNCFMVDEVLRLNQTLGMPLKLDAELLIAADWSDNPSMKTYISKLLNNI